MNSEKKSKHLISMVVPTRSRPQRLATFLASVTATTRVLERLEIVLVIDSDDRSYDDLQTGRLNIRCVVVSPGLPMGELNMAGYAQSTGDYIFLLNDDVVLRTPDWDDRVLEAFRSHSDGIVLVHVNDRLFEEKLCTFPFLTRTFCEKASGICPGGYRRYRIDDHIYNIFNLLSVLGYNRVLYLPDVVFEHENYVRSATGMVEYRPDETIHKIDTELFDSLLGERKALAVEFARLIDAHRNSQAATVRQELLVPIRDSVSLRKPEYVRVWRRDRRPESKTSRVTIGIVSANIRAAHAQACVAAIKKYTSNFDLVILDNNFGPNFNHPREMNRVLGACRTDFLVLMDDDVIVEAGWLDGLLRCVSVDVGVVTPLHKSADGVLSYAGVVMAPDYSGEHSHAFYVDTDAFPIQTLCSAIMLIDMGKCGHLRIDESYSKYFLDIDYGLRVWESGYAVVCSPYTLVTHLGGATLTWGSTRSNELLEAQRQHYISSWIKSGRYRVLEHSPMWQERPAIRDILTLPQRLREIANPAEGQDKTQFLEALHAFFKWLRYYPALLGWASTAIQELKGNEQPEFLSGERWSIAALSAEIGDPKLIEANFRGFNIILWNGFYYAAPLKDGPFIPQRAERDADHQYRAPDLPLLKALIESKVAANEWLPGTYPAPLHQRNLRSILIALMTPRRVAGYARRKLRGARQRLVKTVRGRLRLHYKATATPLRVLPKRRNEVSADRDSHRWVTSSPVMRVGPDYHGWAIYRHEFKYFAVPASSVGFDYDQFRTGTYDRGHIGFSVLEVKKLIDREAAGRENSQSCLVFGCAPADRIASIVAECPAQSTTLLWPSDQAASPLGTPIAKSDRGDVVAWAYSVAQGGEAQLLGELAERHFDKVVIPWSFPTTWRNNALELAASKITDMVEIVHANGARRSYLGENLHRLIYNKAYLCSMFEVVPDPLGSTVLEVGCSDGLVCDIFALLGAKKVVGIDVMQTVGCSFPHPAIEYRTMEAGRLDFPDRSFDIVYSIATLEHVPNPAAVLDEIVRVLKIGGYAYVQAGPLYHSPFGHHMFAYYGDYPWIHLRKSKEEIVAYSREKCIAGAVQRDYGISIEKYIDEMLSFDHVNGLFLNEFGLEDIRKRHDVRILKFNRSYEGQEILTAEIKRELRRFDEAQLTEHGFEIAFQRLQ